ncbi:AraC family transcriptional regulator [Streptomyces cylindrosporus]|uniref:AraC family transcriptional regulator n=1 Tax=Streptomyces cylindrosporus TaxID=2927583 RepID=A0ABS9Y3R2_9ACTN|nr:AraC family transcriptional regulator [Streptomyces cylindrosporus]MCI3271839.1 AraC family transcriptional regulator [Streptomyces cylindrosporus]
MQQSPRRSQDPLIFRTTDVDEAREVIGERFYANFIDVLGGNTKFTARYDIAALGPLTLGRIGFGTEVRIRFGELGSYHVDIPLGGRMAWRQGMHTRAVATTASAAVFQPYGDTTLDRVSTDCPLLAVKINPKALNRQLECLLGRPLRTPVVLAPELDITHGAGLSWVRMVRAAFDEIQAGGLPTLPMVARPLQEALLNGLLLATDHRYRDELDRSGPALRPGPVKRAVEAMHSMPQHPFTVGELATLAGVSTRRLQEAFQQYVGMAPLAYLTDIRLTRAHDELRRGGSGEVNVSAVAHRWGFGHLGRFAARYRARFGELPSQTLRSG